MGFNKGDKVVCIDDNGVCLVNGDVYVVDKCIENAVRIRHNINLFRTYNTARFVNIQEFRDKVIDCVLDL